MEVYQILIFIITYLSLGPGMFMLITAIRIIQLPKFENSPPPPKIHEVMPYLLTVDERIEQLKMKQIELKHEVNAIDEKISFYKHGKAEIKQ